VATPSTGSSIRTNSTYASSTTTSTCAGTRAKNASSSAWVTDGPVGLLGVHTSTTFVRSVIAAAIASRSWRPSAVTGTCTDVAAHALTAIGYASKDRHAKTTSSPGSQNADTI
jgi:hypothetical protein